ncbi:hypothetical protein [Gemmatimonas sp.]|uniref:hypothetical protein n=1 Tax=Gemmatimonas sp. TaxID=1962908 RepID=UPI0039832C56
MPTRSRVPTQTLVPFLSSGVDRFLHSTTCSGGVHDLRHAAFGRTRVFGGDAAAHVAFGDHTHDVRRWSVLESGAQAPGGSPASARAAGPSGAGTAKPVRLPKDVAFGDDVELVLVRSGDVITMYSVGTTIPDYISAH